MLHFSACFRSSSRNAMKLPPISFHKDKEAIDLNVFLSLPGLLLSLSLPAPFRLSFFF